ncbi:hypothetical protein [Streptomyces virginiae]
MEAFAPPADLCREVAVRPDLSWENCQGLGEDYGGGVSAWRTAGWCATREDAQLIARAGVLQHGLDLG